MQIGVAEHVPVLALSASRSALHSSRCWLRLAATDHPRRGSMCEEWLAFSSSSIEVPQAQHFDGLRHLLDLWAGVDETEDRRHLFALQRCENRLRHRETVFARWQASVRERVIERKRHFKRSSLGARMLNGAEECGDCDVRPVKRVRFMMGISVRLFQSRRTTYGNAAGSLDSSDCATSLACSRSGLAGFTRTQ